VGNWLLNRAVYAEWTITALLPVVTAARLLNPADYTDEFAKALLLSLQRNYFALVFGLSAAGLAVKLAQKLLGRWAISHAAMKTVLDSAHKLYFADVEPERMYLHRVTLLRPRRHIADAPRNPFKDRTWRRRLRMYCRSGTQFQQSRTRFLVDDNDELANEGIAGRAWFTNAQAMAVNLPEWPNPTPPDPSADATCMAYAAAGSLPVRSAAALKVHSRSVHATVVRTKAGERWGVVVFDSREPDGVSDAPEKQALVNLTASLLTQMV
jgi:hypothetical protein